MTSIMGAVAAATAALSRAYQLGSVPAAPTYPYGVYSAALGRGDSYTLDATEGVRHGRITVQTFGKTTESALALAEQIRTALVGIRLTITDHSCDAIRAELDPQIVRDPDVGGVVGVTATYTFTATQE